MTHLAREKSETGFYHVVTKGNGGQIIFEDKLDRSYYVSCIKAASEKTSVRIHAYCLMSNHVHFVIEDVESNIGAFMKNLDEQYAIRFNRKAGRKGSVFQNRFWSEPIDCDEYLLAAVRYVHHNPETAGICKAKDYPWSSYEAYVSGSSFVTTHIVLSLLGGTLAFERFHASTQQYAKPFATSKLSRHLNPDELTALALEILGRETLVSLKMLSVQERNVYLDKLSQAGFTTSEIARITGLSQPTVHRSLHSAA